jgi:ABC-2 type transport system permease protein
VNTRLRFAYGKRVVLELLQTLFAVYAFVYVWTSLQADGKTGTASLESLITYTVLSQLLSALLPTDLIARLFESDISTGNVTHKLLRPISMPAVAVATFIGTVAASFLLRTIPIFIGSLFFVTIELPKSAVSWAAFLILMTSGIIISILMDLLSGYLCFWIFQGRYIRHFFEALFILFSGRFVPLSLLPSWFQTVSYWVPTRVILNDPISVFTGIVPPEQYGATLLRSGAWLVGLFLIVVSLHRAGLKRVFVQGG